jgi:uncharacterized protein
MKNHDFDSRSVSATAHRPWPMPRGPWGLAQTWNDLLFAHWPVDPAALRARIPAPFALDLFDGAAWLSVVPFEITNFGPRGVPSLPGISTFPEVNVRTYVTVDDRPGVYFFSLDAGSALAVAGARTLLNLPYFTAAIEIARPSRSIAFRSVRKDDASATLKATYHPVGETFAASPGSCEHFLVERYCLYHHDRRGVPYRLEIHHAPWPLQPAAATFETNTLAEASGLHVDGAPSLLHFARRLDVVAWLPTRLQ